MSTTMLEQLYSSQLRAAEETIEAWRPQEQGDLSASELAEVVGAVLRITNYPVHAVRRANERVRKGEVLDLDSTARSLHRLFDSAIHMIDALLELDRVRRLTGRPIDVGADLAASAQNLRLERAALLGVWPWSAPMPATDPRRIAESLAAVARGDCQDLSELIRDARGDTAVDQP
ncbi:MAG: hypothetical protein K2R98_10670 [Gemmataceae bacterium]|nr:hypothetical protein [Gemmataceae bacterium]